MIVETNYVISGVLLMKKYKNQWYKVYELLIDSK